LTGVSWSVLMICTGSEEPADGLILVVLAWFVIMKMLLG
jgi:hypothetical protein